MLIIIVKYLTLAVDENKLETERKGRSEKKESTEDKNKKQEREKQKGTLFLVKLPKKKIYTCLFSAFVKFRDSQRDDDDDDVRENGRERKRRGKRKSGNIPSCVQFP